MRAFFVFLTIDQNFCAGFFEPSIIIGFSSCVPHIVDQIVQIFDFFADFLEQFFSLIVDPLQSSKLGTIFVIASLIAFERAWASVFAFVSAKTSRARL